MKTFLTFRDTHGRRPSAAELFANNVQMKPVRQRYAGWFEFVDQQGDLDDDDERRVMQRHASWFRDLLTTKMTKSYKMLAVEALLENNLLFEGAPVADNAVHALHIARRNLLLYRELKDDAARTEHTAASVAKWKEMPLGVGLRAVRPRSPGSRSRRTGSFRTTRSTTRTAPSSRP